MDVTDLDRKDSYYGEEGELAAGLVVGDYDSGLKIIGLVQTDSIESSGVHGKDNPRRVGDDGYKKF